jgi:hypothetical protein
MNFKTTLVLLVLLVLAGVAVLLTRNGGDEPVQSADADAGRKLIELDQSDVIKVAVNPSAGEPFVLEKSGGAWRVAEPVSAPAEPFAVDSLVGALVNLRSRGSIGSDASSAATGLDEPTYRIELTGAGGNTHNLTVGQKSAVGDILYVSVGDEKQAEVVDAGLYEQLEKPLSDYRRKQLVNVASQDVKQITIVKPDSKLILQKHGEQWQVVEPVKIPAEKTEVDDLIFAATGLRVEEFVSEAPADAAQYALNAPRLTVTLSTEAPATQPATRPATATAGTTIRIGRYDDVRQKNVYATVSGAPTIAKVPATVLASFDKKPLDLRDRRVLDIMPEKVSRIRVMSDLPAATQPTTRLATKTELVLERRPVPATQPTTMQAGTTQAAATQAATQPSTQPTSQWQIVSDPLGPANDSRVSTLLSALNPLRAQRYVEPSTTAPATQPTDRYVLTITTGGTGVTPQRTYEIRLRGTGSDQPVIGEYNGLAFEVDRSLLGQLGGDFTWKPAPAAPQQPSETPDGFPGFLPPPDAAGP